MTPIDWLLSGPPWVEYRARLDLLQQPENEPEVARARQMVLDTSAVNGLLAEVAHWPGPPLKRHNDAAHLLHKLVFVTELGVRAHDRGMPDVVDRILDLRSANGVFQVLVNIPQRFGGSGNDQESWMLCDAPLILYALARLGLRRCDAVKDCIKRLSSLVRDNGWPCAASPDLGGFRGPGRKADPCPYATLVMLRALAQFPELDEGDAARTGVEALLTLWERRSERRPYLFAMGTRFARLKAPLIWYDIVHVLDVLTLFPFARRDPRLLEMLALVEAKADDQGRFTCESVWRAWKGWSFGQKREASRWLTLLVWRLLLRAAPAG